MCGIVGLINKTSSVSEDLLKEMSNRLKHRGPDGDGVYVNENVGIAHRRLSFIDLKGGQQPLSNEDDTIWITYNGELYNFKELKVILEKKGHVFRTNSDTEVIVHAYEEWGEDCVNHFRGMFAFAIVDTIKQEVFLARDHIGIKPLYYSIQHDFVAFTSELQAFKVIPKFNFEIDLKALDQYLWLQYIPAPHSIFKSVKKLNPGNSIRFSFKGELISLKKYWNFKYSDTPNKKTEEDYVQELDVVLKDSVSKHLISEVPFGAFLSGGLDSTLVVSYMQELLDYPVKTFSIGFEEEAFNELPYAQEAATKLNTEHHVEIVKQEALTILPEIVKHYGEPFGDSSAIPTYYVCKMASSKVKMVLSGDGGDEAFAGYKTYSQYLKYEHPEEKKTISELKYRVGNKLFPSKIKDRDSLAKWINYIKYLPLDWRKELWKPEFHNNINTISEEFEDYYSNTKHFDSVQKLQFMDLKTYLPSDILTKVDRASMMHSLEVRTPLVDKSVWEFSASIPSEFNLKKEDGDWNGKRLLKKLLEKKFSKEFVHRKKMGFSIPRDSWFKVGGGYRKELEEILYNKSSYISNYFSHSGIQKVLNSNNYGAMWLLLFLEFWLKDFHENR